MVTIKGKFDIDDIAQQGVGGLVVGGPFIVTDEVWGIASSMNLYNVLFTFLIVLVMGYGVLYVAVLRDPEVEASLGVVPLRFVSLIFISYMSSIVISLATGASFFFAESSAYADIIWLMFKASTTVSVFTVIGAGTADSIFGDPVEREL